MNYYEIRFNVLNDLTTIVNSRGGKHRLHKKGYGFGAYRFHKGITKYAEEYVIETEDNVRLYDLLVTATRVGFFVIESSIHLGKTTCHIRSVSISDQKADLSQIFYLATVIPTQQA